MSHADDYPDDHDPLFAAVVTAAGWARTRGDRDALVVLDELLDAMRDDRVGQMAALIDTHRRPVVTPHVAMARAWQLPGEAAS